MPRPLRSQARSVLGVGPLGYESDGSRHFSPTKSKVVSSGHVLPGSYLNDIPAPWNRPSPEAAITQVVPSQPVLAWWPLQWHPHDLALPMTQARQVDVGIAAPGTVDG